MIIHVRSHLRPRLEKDSGALGHLLKTGYESLKIL